MSLHASAVVVKLRSQVSDAARWALNETNGTRKCSLSPLEGAVRSCTHIPNLAALPHLCSLSSSACKVFFVCLFVCYFPPWRDVVLGKLRRSSSLSPVESSRRRCEGRCSRRGRWGPAEPLTAACSCGFLLATPAAPYLGRTWEKDTTTRKQLINKHKFGEVQVFVVVQSWYTSVHQLTVDWTLTEGSGEIIKWSV